MSGTLIIKQGKLKDAPKQHINEFGGTVAKFMVEVKRRETKQTASRINNVYNCTAYGETAEQILSELKAGDLIKFEAWHDTFVNDAHVTCEHCGKKTRGGKVYGQEVEIIPDEFHIIKDGVEFIRGKN
ncbi:MAG: single-stranded DNA-binding protein [Firmicutes bacterium]|nr:single-stranded DNA-binding protein [Bacillota bacterium]